MTRDCNDRAHRLEKGAKVVHSYHHLHWHAPAQYQAKSQTSQWTVQQNMATIVHANAQHAIFFFLQRDSSLPTKGGHS